MKTFFKSNLLWVFALVAGIGMMSFKMTAQHEETIYWFKVKPDLTIGGSIDPDELCPGGDTPCAIAFSRDYDLPATLTAGRTDDDYQGEAFQD